MSKNPAWNAYNETVRKANEEYEEAIKPLRADLTDNIESIDFRFNPKIEALVRERDTLTKNLKDAYSDSVLESEKTRRETVNRAHKVLKAELEAGKMAQI